MAVDDEEELSFKRLPSGKIILPLLIDGLGGSADWQRDKQVTERGTLKQPRDRSVLIQTKEHLADLQATFPTLAQNFTKPTSFGENLLVSGDITADTLCVGDVIHIMRPEDGSGQVVGILQVSNPRLPCFKVDYKHRTSQPGEPAPRLTVRGYCASTGRGGFFCRVLQPGSIAAGDRLIVVQRPLPQWTLHRISDLIYGGVNSRHAELRSWRGTEEQLHELLNLEVIPFTHHACSNLCLHGGQLLGWFEWREALHKYVAKRQSLEAEIAREQAEAEATCHAEERRVRDERAYRTHLITASAIAMVLALAYLLMHVKRIYLPA